MKHALQTQIQNVKTWLANIKAHFKPLQELKYLGDILWQLK
ncbi:MAG: hypothetical protein SFU55_04600 [Methylophilus sp.]|nr:hypothetical protein [Methylophilus sp.]